MLLDQKEGTARMNHQHPRRFLTPGAGSSRLKRKEREQPFYPTKPSPLAPVELPAPASPRATVTTATTVTTSKGSRSGVAMSSNQLLAGYMAYEFLTKGTLLGEKVDPARSEAVPVSGRRGKSGGGANPVTTKKQSDRYMEVASLLMRQGEGGGGGNGPHIPGVVNPSQLARWIEM